MDQLAEISMEGAPQLPARTGNVRADSAALAQYERNLAQHFEKQGGGFNPAAPKTHTANGAQPAAVEPNADDLAVLKEVQADTMKRFAGSSQVNRIIDEAYRTLHAGGRLDREAIAEALDRATETQESRELAKAVDVLAAAIDTDGTITPDRIPPQLMSGYALPAGKYDAERTVALLRTARELGLTQSQVDRYIELQGEG